MTRDIRAELNAIVLTLFALLLCSAAVCGTAEEIDEHAAELGIGAGL